MLVTFILIIFALFNSIIEGTDSKPIERPLYRGNYAIECAEQVLSAEYPETPGMPKKEQYINDSAFKIAKAKYINGGSVVTLEDGVECNL